MFSSRDTVRYEERGQGYRDVEKVGKHCSTPLFKHSVRKQCTSVNLTARCLYTFSLPAEENRFVFRKALLLLAIFEVLKMVHFRKSVSSEE